MRFGRRPKTTTPTTTETVDLRPSTSPASTAAARQHLGDIAKRPEPTEGRAVKKLREGGHRSKPAAPTEDAYPADTVELTETVDVTEDVPENQDALI